MRGSKLLVGGPPAVSLAADLGTHSQRGVVLASPFALSALPLPPLAAVALVSSDND